MVRIKLLITFMALCLSASLFAQTSPQPFPVANADLIFQGFTDPTSEEYPPYMQGWTGDHFATTETEAPGNIQGVGDFPLSGQGAKTLAQISNQGSGGIGIKAGCDGDGPSPIAIAVALDTRGATGISVTWTGHLIEDAPNVDTRIQLQYRVGSSGAWTNVAGHNYQATSGLGVPSTRFGPTTLPSAIENKELVQFRWFSYQFQQGVLFFCNGDHARIDSVQFTANVKVPQKPQAEFVVSNSTPLKNEPINFTDQSSGAPTKWYWDFGDGTTDTLQNPVKIYDLDGVYTVQLIATNSVGSDTMTKVDYITAGNPGGVANSPEEMISVYPNPGTGKVHIIAPQAGNGRLSIYNMLGELVFENADANLSKEIDLSGLKKGGYLLRLEKDGKIYTARFSLIQ